MKTLFVTLILCSAALAKDKSDPTYQNAIFQETHMESVRMNCGGTGYENTMTTCHDAETVVYTVKTADTVYTLIPYGDVASSRISLETTGRHFCGGVE